MTPKKAGVHITTGGFEYDRIIIPMLSRYPVDKLLILRSRRSPYTGARDLAGDFLKKVMKTPIDIEVINVDIYDFNEVFIETLKQIERYAEDGHKIYINISPVPKLATTAMISAAFLSPYKMDIEIFYAAPKSYMIPEIMEALLRMNEKDALERVKELRDRFMDKGAAVGVEGYQRIPVFPIKDISEGEREILFALDERGGVDSIEELVGYINEARKEEVKRSSIQYRLETLEEKKLVETERADRRLKINLNRLGKLYLASKE
ncbi:MAG: DUF6293 family protein [Thermoplasmata archaeon]